MGDQAAVDDRIFYVNLEALKSRLKSQDTGMIAGISVAGAFALVLGVFVIVAKEGKFELAIATTGMVVAMVSVLIIYIDNKGQINKIEERVQKYKTTYYDEISKVECPVHFVKKWDDATGRVVCSNNLNVQPASGSPALITDATPEDFSAMTAEQREKYPFPFFLAPTA